MLEYLQDISSEEIRGPGRTLPTQPSLGFKVRFHFAPDNPYFSNVELPKMFYVESKSGSSNGKLRCTRVEAPDRIQWRPGRDVTQRKTPGPAQDKIVGKHKGFDEEEEVDSDGEDENRQASFFIDFFVTLCSSADNEMDDRDVRTDLKKEYTLGCRLKDDIIPRALEWFMGERDSTSTDDEPEEENDEKDKEADEEEEEDEEEDEEGEEEEGEEDEDEEEDEEEDEDEVVFISSSDGTHA